MSEVRDESPAPGHVTETRGQRSGTVLLLLGTQLRPEVRDESSAPGRTTETRGQRSGTVLLILGS